MFAQIFISGITMGCIYAMVGFGFALVFNSTQIFNFAQGEFLMLGAMMHYTGTVLLKLPFGLSLILSMATLSIVAIFIELTAFSWLRKKRASIIMMVMAFIAFSLLFKNISEMVWGKYPLMVKGFFTEEHFQIAGIMVQSQSLAVMISTGVSLVILWLFFSRTMYGMAVMASAYNIKRAYLCGVSVHTMIITSFALSAATSALAGVIVGPISFITPSMGFELGIKGFAAAVVGGMGSPVGAILGGLLIGILESLLGCYVSTAYSTLMAFTFMLLVLYIRPEGILGVASR